MPPDNLVWYALAWFFLMSPFYFLAVVFFFFMIDVRRFMNNNVTMIVHKDGKWSKEK